MSPMEQYIREYAASIGLNPDVVIQTVLAEGGHQSLEPAGYARQSEVINEAGVREPSFGPFQMYMSPGALGDRALKAGYDPRDPSQAFGVAKFAMDTMKREGLGAWHGWKGDPWAASAGTGTGADVAMPTVDMRYDPRSDSPSYARPIGSKLPGPGPTGGQYNLRSPGEQAWHQGAQFGPPMPAKQPATKGDLWAAFGKGLSGMGGTGGGGGFDTRMPAQPAAVLSSEAAAPIIDMQTQQAQRQALAEVMARLNAGRLWG